MQGQERTCDLMPMHWPGNHPFQWDLGLGFRVQGADMNMQIYGGKTAIFLPDTPEIPFPGRNIRPTCTLCICKRSILTVVIPALTSLNFTHETAVGLLPVYGAGGQSPRWRFHPNRTASSPVQAFSTETTMNTETELRAHPCVVSPCRLGPRSVAWGNPSSRFFWPVRGMGRGGVVRIRLGWMVDEESGFQSTVSFVAQDSDNCWIDSTAS